MKKTESTDSANTDILVAVRLVEKRGSSGVFEWMDGETLRRVILPLEAFVDGAIESETLALGVPYGLDWGKLITFHATPELLTEALHRAGIWTPEDLITYQQAAYGCLQSVYGLDLASLIQTADRARKERK